MIEVEYKGLRALFDTANTKWVSEEHQDFAVILNKHIPDEIYQVDSIYYKGKREVEGRDGWALEGLAFLDKDLKVVQYIPELVPVEVRGV